MAGHPATGYQLRSVPDLLLPEILAAVAAGHDFFRAHSPLITKLGRPIRRPCRRRRKALRRAAYFWPKSKRRGAGGVDIRWHSATVGGDLLFGGSAAGVAAFGNADPFAGGGVGGACRGCRKLDSSCIAAGFEMAQRCADRRKKFCGILTEMNSEATRVRYIVVGIGINVNQTSVLRRSCETLATSLRMSMGQRMVARGTGHSFAKIAAPRISRS